MGEITVAEASHRAGVSARRVRALVTAGDLAQTRRVGRTILIDSQSVDAWRQHRDAGMRGGRPWTAAVAWGALAVLSGGDAQWLTAAQRRRLMAALEDLSPEMLLAKVRRRAQIRSLSGLFASSALVVPTGGYALKEETVAARFGLAAGAASWDGYCAHEDLGAIVDELGLYESGSPDHTLRVIQDRRWLEALAVARREVLVAVDLAESALTRERSAGLRVIQDVLEKVR
ncbi:helix-turn-helix domain-containing protein [Mycobacteroides abscessus]|uniref:helix-turn-helix domain-containing protein n=1 Tax=Mycobacteroides abscessus TaxID=36809 RepID=UPI000C255F0C|nr:helix-turn-helix domain-containing protein [Mycobacteroides abscessus]